METPALTEHTVKSSSAESPTIYKAPMALKSQQENLVNQRNPSTVGVFMMVKPDFLQAFFCHK
jgi:hypothetical protein